MTDEQFEQELKRLKELDRIIIFAYRNMMRDYTKIREYEKALQEYENAKKEFYRKLQW